ncbi:MAG: DoxX family protein [Ectothiorhodospiraceae bacterium]|nr:DoxX family protein [Chromatiales bacterium]MCP5153597.1 DoxX family protein [Ectothiorhodospiraceae bacterium]
MSHVPASTADHTTATAPRRLDRAHRRLVTAVQAVGDRWLLGLVARFAFAATLLPYYLASALTKPGEGWLGLLAPAPGAFAQILPPIAEHYVYDTAAIPFFPWHLVVIAGTIAELVLPVMVTVGLLTRWAALAMIGFVLVQTFVDVSFHGAALGVLFDGKPGGLADQRLLWVVPLLVLVLRGAGTVSLDRLLAPRR